MVSEKKEFQKLKHTVRERETERERERLRLRENVRAQVNGVLIG